MAALPNPQPTRPWREIAQELAEETNGQRIQELAEELSRALAEQTPSGQK
jgi:hypothetical protein